jgi:hypothetical protein
MADVHDDDDPAQRATRTEIGIDQLSPVLSLLARDGGVSVPGQVDQTPPGLELEEVDQARGTGSLAGLGERLALRERVDRRGFARVRAAGRPRLQRRNPARTARDDRRSSGT